MQRSGITLACFLLFFISTVFAQQNKAIIRLLKPIVAEIAASPNVGGWTWETNGNGGFLIRKLMDVTGDGRPELFVASTLESSKHAHVWHVFDVSEDGILKPYDTTLNFISASPRTENGQHYLDLFPFADQERLRTNHEKPYRVVRYSFSFPAIEESTFYVSEADAVKIQPNDLTKLPKLQAILLADYLAKPNIEWADVAEWKLDANDCFFRLEDKERAIKNTSFTPQEALRFLGEIDNEGQREKRRPDFPTEVRSNLKDSKTQDSMSDQNSADTEFITQLTWTILAILIAISVVSWLKLRNQ
jgi:hypothetical protein